MHDVVLDTILDKFSFLTDVFTTKPQLENMLAFVLAIPLSTGCTIQSFADWLGGWKNQSSLNRFLTESGWKLAEFWHCYHQWLGEKIAQTKGNVYFIIDDSKAKKTGCLIERATKDYDTNENRQVLCHTLVVSILRMAGQNFLLQFALYDKTKKETKLFKSKLDIAIEQAAAFVKLIGMRRKIIFLFDSWYCCSKFISTLPKWAGWVSRLKRNRLVKIGEFWQSLPEISGCVNSWDYRRVEVKKGSYFWACSIRVELKELGMVTLVFAKSSKHARRVDFFVSNLDASAEEILRHYAERWEVEVFFRTAKQNLGLDGYQMRKFRGNRRYWSLVFLSYAILSVLQGCWKRTCKTIGKTIAELRVRMQKQVQDYGRGYGLLIENYVGGKIAKL